MLIEELVNKLENNSFEECCLANADDSVFIERIRTFEAKYSMMWFVFVEAYESRQLSACNEDERLDYAEWHMLCEKFQQELEDAIEIMAESPPGEEQCLAEGPSNRAFCFATLACIHGANA